MVECDEILVPTDLWARVKSNEPNAKTELRTMLNGMVLYTHALYWPEPHVSVTAREVSAALDDGMTLTIGFEC